ncbi:hypothetical protein WA026_008975 [Henosepilachna vigintioctopunctata]|uniref:SUI1 domain-containing protein n=1 Tax=Henosepilachna vigintioctopunctata TaxID=420089 RepID=A0AAW1V3B2_9CUCU
MFRKPFKVKSNTPVKSSERKNIKDKIHKQYPSLTEDDLNNLLPKKDVLNTVKVVTASGEIIHIYTIQKKPLCFELYGKMFPTLYFLWQFPNLIHNFTTHKDVLGFINSGADLMLPGVLTPPAHSITPKYGGGIQKDSIVAINLSTNKASFAVGTAVMSSAEMENSGARGKCVSIVHFYGDKLCCLEGQAILTVPNMGPPEWLLMKSYEEDFPSLGSCPKKEESNRNISILTNEELEHESTEPNQGENNVKSEDVASISADMTIEEVDETLHYCFFTAIKYSKTMTLPILTSNFYKIQMLPVCPIDKTLDIKKSSFKKLKPFLDKMCQENIITVKEIKKGVESIVAINKSHPQFEAFYTKPENRPGANNQENSNTLANSTNITESFIITNSVLAIFKCGETKMEKGNTVTGTTVKQYIREYIAHNKCYHENPKLVKLDTTLSTICKSTNPITWEEVYEKVCDSMKNCFKVQTGQEEIMNKGKLSPIVISVANRSGNKKVTLVDNLELFGIRISEFAKECQHGVAASTSISVPPGKKVEQLLVQGNQVLFVYNLLVDKYKISKRYIRGLENAPKKKK